MILALHNADIDKHGVPMAQILAWFRQDDKFTLHRFLNTREQDKEEYRKFIKWHKLTDESVKALIQ